MKNYTLSPEKILVLEGIDINLPECNYKPMKNYTLSPKGIDINNDTALAIYYSLYARGFADAVPPVIVIKNNNELRAARTRTCASRIEDMKNPNRAYYLPRDGILYPGENGVLGIREGYAQFEQRVKESPYYLLDGNHRTTAATLCHAPIPVLELERDNDVSRVQSMIAQGEINDFGVPLPSVRALAEKFENHILGTHDEFCTHIERLMTVEERVRSLVDNEEIPGYMCQRYRRGK